MRKKEYDKGWLPIHSAPRDGSHFWGIEPRSCGVFETWWVGSGFFCLDGGEHWSTHPTHWKPKVVAGGQPAHPGMLFYELPQQDYDEADLIERAEHSDSFIEPDPWPKAP